MTLEEAEKALANDSTNKALAWALEELKKAQSEIEDDDKAINVWRNRTLRAELALDTMFMEAEFAFLTSADQNSRLKRLMEFADSLRSTKKEEPRVVWLKATELRDVLSHRMKHTLFIGGVARHDRKVLQLIRGDFRKIEVPFSTFEPSGEGIEPDFSRLSIIDHGHTIALGDYQAASDKIQDDHEDVHTRHCCVYHSCKYSDNDCTVTSGHKPQSYSCEYCNEE